MDTTSLNQAYLDWMGSYTYAITFVFNLNNLGKLKGAEALREFHRLVDKDRFGGRYYEKTDSERLWFRVVPEKWRAHPHFHGLIVLPEDQVRQHGFDAVCEKYESIWKEVCPGGSLLIEPLHDGPGWVSYASKENSLVSSLTAIDSYIQSPKLVWSPQRD